MSRDPRKEFFAKDFTCDQERLVCLAMDCFRLAMGLKPRNFSQETCVGLLQLRVKHNHELAAAKAQEEE